MLTAPALRFRFGRLPSNPTQLCSYFLRADANSYAGLIAAAGVLTLLNGLYQIVFLFWVSASPGKMLVSQQVLDFRTGAPPTFRQCVVRWLSASVI